MPTSRHRARIEGSVPVATPADYAAAELAAQRESIRQTVHAASTEDLIATRTSLAATFLATSEPPYGMDAFRVGAIADELARRERLAQQDTIVVGRGTKIENPQREV